MYFFLYPGMKSENCTRKLEINYIDVVRYSLITSFFLNIVEMVRPKIILCVLAG